MTELLTAAQMRTIEQAAIASGEVTGLELMERAGRGVVEAILEWRPELATAPHKAVVLCGPGNNGGDGFVVARLLKQRGWEVEVFLYGDEAKLPPDAAENARRLREMGGINQVANLDPNDLLADNLTVIDACFGTGASRPLPQQISSLCSARAGYDLASHRNYLVSIDLPSGLDSDSGWIVGEESFAADLTVAFHAAKYGHHLSDGPSRCGVLRIVDIGLESQRSVKALIQLHRLETRRGLGRHVCHCTDAPKFLIDRKSQLFVGDPRHKYDKGHALFLSGGVGHGGAARLAARGALRVGAGLVTIGAPPAAIIENAAQLNAIMLRRVADADALAEFLEDERLNSLCLGPGLGVGAHTLGLVAAALSAKRGTVLDADALTSFAEDPPKLFALLHENCVLTPHMGEFARLFPDIAAKLNEPATKGPAYSKVDAAREAAARAGCVILLKGPDTVIADPQGSAAINSAHYDRAAPWLATAGSGDVLAGMITGLLVRGLAPMQAAETAAWLHVEAARKFGPGLIAEDLPEMLPAVFRDLGL
jgi:hydroxyethylthiazole kinase-like uncharacterized protein yjeF